MWDLVGKIACLYIVFKGFLFAWNFMRMYVFTKFGFKENLRHYGEWAVITGSTDGIGREYARQLARQGFKIVLISRSQEKLNKVAEEIRIESKQEVKTIAFDFKNIDGYDRIADVLSKLEIGVLVNNVGVSYQYPDWFCNLKVEVFEEMVKVNIFSVLKMTHMLLPQMRMRKKGVIINLSSAAGVRPMPLLTVYSATKSFTHYFSRAVQMEYEKDGIVCQVVSPFYVATNMTGIKIPSMIVPLPETISEQGLEAIGKGDCCGYYVHEAIAFAISLAPEWLFKNLMLYCLTKRTTHLKRKLKSK